VSSRQSQDGECIRNGLTLVEGRQVRLAVRDPGEKHAA